MRTFTKFIRLTKVDAAQREVSGIVTSETPDKDGEICDYATTVPYYKAWSAEFDEATGGKSLGNVREMHTRSAVGKVLNLVCSDAEKTIAVRARIVDDDAWKKCEEGVYTGFSHGGEYVGETWPDGEFTRYTAKPTEISLVDNPCNPEAHFEYVKADGSVELRKFLNPFPASRFPFPVESSQATGNGERETGNDEKFAGGDPTLEHPAVDPSLPPSPSRHLPSEAADSNNAAPPATDTLPVARSKPALSEVEGFPVSDSPKTNVDGKRETLRLRSGQAPDGGRETDKLAKAVLEHQRQIADLAGAVRNLAEALAKVLAEPQTRKTLASGIVVTKEQDGEIANHNPEPQKATDPKALLKECLSRPILS
jgi:hypothetical protein